ncbi:hypothetical protein [Legionella parisiensis]|uniref:Uncharacterized protein n=1 Tax=Legionella parisiensis TaxID=45071 RepID=A0A1E5JNU7_9GAMM|nr:hypothetical protein [Legionella parisiensis]KTD41392.1 hypothetical protein Lpar_2709 [Legionella parisiensis]OEH46140.1 hypothetical protein lpari_02873 [Legionella parisiensis]STX76305.1 Uncharacterised protein [Legionella parisiensis]
MDKLCAKIGVVSLLMSVSLFGWAGSGACKAIAISCMQNGYFKGGENAGKELVKDCVLPVAMGKKQLPNTNFSPEQLQQCKMKLAEKIKGKMQEKMQEKMQQ